LGSHRYCLLEHYFDSFGGHSRDAVGDQGEPRVAEFAEREVPFWFWDYRSCLVVGADLDVVAFGVVQLGET
jgi:hypothetical protein